MAIYQQQAEKPPKLGDMQQEDGTLTKDDHTKAQLLNNFFASVFTCENTEMMPNMRQRHRGAPLDNLVITEDMLKKKLRKLKPTKSSGPDGLHPRVLQETASTISLPLSVIFTKSLHENRLSATWKTGHITPIHKKGKKTIPGNYRPVSLTSVVGKVMESLIRDKLVEHMTEGRHFCDAQHGFVPGRSCMTQLLVTLELWTDWLDKGEALDVIYLDFKKAFDSVPHIRLLQKLKAYGVEGDLLNWIQHFLMERKQRVSVNGILSDWVIVLSGIPQGSVLGPILFVIFINDLPDMVKSTAKIFADDTKIFNRVLNRDDHQQMQADLNYLVK